jgi:poly(hydroxyalkanoate) depolymerase family esterase
MDPMEATRIIQAALAGRSDPPVTPPLAEITTLPPRSPRRGGPRRTLGAVIARLKKGKEQFGSLAGLRPGGPKAPAAPLPVPDGAEFRAAQFTSRHGSRDYRLYIPAALAGEPPAGLVVMLHGCTQNPEDFARGTGMNALAERHRLLVAYPAQTRSHNAAACWNWFRPGDQTRETGEPALIAALALEIAAAHAVPRHRLFAAGLSAGGAMAATLAETHPDLFSAIGVHSGLAAGSASDLVSAFAAMRGEAADTPPPTPRQSARMIVFHGTADRTVHPSNARRVADRAATDAEIVTDRVDGPRPATRITGRGADGTSRMECWMVEGIGHAWSGGDVAGSYTDPEGPDASAEMIRFFLES